MNNSKIKKVDYERNEEGNENESKLISDSCQNKTNILSRIKKHDPNDIPTLFAKEDSKQRKTDLGDAVSKKLKIEEKKREPIIKNEEKSRKEYSNEM